VCDASATPVPLQRCCRLAVFTNTDKTGKARNGERPLWRTRLGPHGRTFLGRNGEC